MPDNRHAVSSRIDVEKAALLPPVTGCVEAARPRAEAARGSHGAAPCIRRKVGGPTRKSSKGGWTPEEVRGGLAVCRGPRAAGAATSSGRRLDE